MNLGEDNVRIVLVDDHTLFREGIKELLSTEPGIDVVAEGSSGPEAIDLACRHQPHILLLDVEMPGPGAKQTIRQLGRAAPLTKVIVLTMHDESSLVHELLECGASAYLVKTIAREELIAAVRSVSRSHGNVLVSVSRETIERLDRQVESPLSARELEVLRLTAQALSNAQIAGRLYITEGTVKRHLTNIYAKLGAVSRVDAIRKATAARLINGVGD